MATVYIYALCEPDLWQEVRYIGASANPKKRLGQHLADSNIAAEDSPKNRWLKALKAKRLKPILRILDQTDDPLWWGTLEATYIKRFASIRLTNRHANDAYWQDLWSRPQVMIPFAPRLKRSEEGA